MRICCVICCEAVNTTPIIPSVHLKYDFLMVRSRKCAAHFNPSHYSSERRACTLPIFPVHFKTSAGAADYISSSFHVRRTLEIDGRLKTAQPGGRRGESFGKWEDVLSAGREKPSQIISCFLGVLRPRRDYWWLQHLQTPAGWRRAAPLAMATRRRINNRVT